MVAVGAVADMPHNQYSGVILGGSWPGSDPDDFKNAATAQRAKADQLFDFADKTRGEADSAAAEMSGHLVDGFYQACYRLAAEYDAEAKELRAMADACDEVAWLLDGLRQRLTEIDHEAHAEIERLEQVAAQSGIPAGTEIIKVATDARHTAREEDAKTSAAITRQGTHLGFGNSNPAAAADAGGKTPQSTEPAAAGTGNPGGTPTIRQAGLHGGPAPERTGPGETPPQTGGKQPSGTDPNAGQPDESDVNKPPNAPGKLPQSSSYQPGEQEGGGAGSAPGISPPASLPSGGVAAAPLGGGGASGGSGGGLKLPSSGMPGGSGGGGLPTQGLTSPAGLSPGSGAPPAAASDFSRGFGAGAGASGAPTPFAAPVRPATPTATGSAAGPDAARNGHTERFTGGDTDGTVAAVWV